MGRHLLVHSVNLVPIVRAMKLELHAGGRAKGDCDGEKPCCSLAADAPRQSFVYRAPPGVLDRGREVLDVIYVSFRRFSTFLIITFVFFVSPQTWIKADIGVEVRQRG